MLMFMSQEQIKGIRVKECRHMLLKQCLTIVLLHLSYDHVSLNGWIIFIK